MLEWLRFSIALHPIETDDSGQVLALPPNPRGASFPEGFRRMMLQVPLSHRPPKLLGTTGPATYGLRASIKIAPRIPDFKTRSQLDDRPFPTTAIPLWDGPANDFS